MASKGPSIHTPDYDVGMMKSLGAFKDWWLCRGWNMSGLQLCTVSINKYDKRPDRKGWRAGEHEFGG